MARRPPRIPWWLALAGASYVAYFLLLIYCDLRRPEAMGLVASRTADALFVQSVAAGSPAEAAGVRPGDRLAVANGRPIRRRTDWSAVEATLGFHAPIALQVERGGEIRHLAIVLRPASPRFWLTSAGLALLAVRATQLATLLIALGLAFKRPSDLHARIGGWLLASGSVFCVMLPARLAAVWHALPPPIDLLLWFPFGSSLAIGAVLLTFFLQFPRPVPHARTLLALAWLPMTLVVASFATAYARLVYAAGTIAESPVPHTVMAATAAYGITAMGILVVHARRLEDVNDRRRAHLLIPGSLTALAAGVLMLIVSWRRAPAQLSGPVFSSPLLIAGTFALLTLPISFAYAILRQRLFGLMVLVRNGLRYAAARRLVLSLTPLLLTMLVVDVASHRHGDLQEFVATRRGVYLALSGVALLAHLHRDRWLAAVDRRYFHERYDSRRLMEQIAGELRAAGQLDRVAARLVAHIEAALHPRVAALMVRREADAWFRTLASAPSGAAPRPLSGASRLVAMGRVLGGPFATTDDHDDVFVRQLPAGEQSFLRESNVELVLPIRPAEDGDEALLLLGPKRSEEPYSSEDLELLSQVTTAVAPLLDRLVPIATPAAGLEECPACGACFDAGTARCPADESPLEFETTVRVLADRYRLDRRLGQGGMGKVYAAADLALARSVAVKLLRQRGTRSAEAAARFQREARIAASFRHPNVVTVYDFGVADGRAFLVMELLEGRTLRDALRVHGRLDLDEAIRALRGICGAVEEAHRRLLVHADLKPENIFLSPAGRGNEVVKVLDFGVAISLADADDDASAGLGGTPPYMAPEQLRGEPPLPSWDVWALAVMTFELITGALPFTAAGTDAVEDRPTGAEVPSAPPSGWPAPLSERLGPALAPLEPFFRDALAIEPGKRPASPAAFLAAFETAARTCALAAEAAP